MDESTIRRLNALNQQFYEIVANDFDATRQKPWAGWRQLTPYLHSGMRVLDVGCGNGRFGVFIAENLQGASSYTGLDSSSTLLERARLALAHVQAQLLVHDVVTAPLGEDMGQFDLVVLFGVLHHVPGAAQRLDLMRRLARCVEPGGWLVFSEWRFYEDERLRARILPWDAEMQIEPGDYLLDWRRGTTALRYCHYVDEQEHQQLLAATGLARVAEFRADSANLYSVLHKPLA